MNSFAILKPYNLNIDNNDVINNIIMKYLMTFFNELYSGQNTNEN